jgi:hypothetical protein
VRISSRFRHVNVSIAHFKSNKNNSNIQCSSSPILDFTYTDEQTEEALPKKLKDELLAMGLQICDTNLIQRTQKFPYTNVSSSLLWKLESKAILAKLQSNCFAIHTLAYFLCAANCLMGLAEIQYFFHLNNETADDDALNETLQMLESAEYLYGLAIKYIENIRNPKLKLVESEKYILFYLSACERRKGRILAKLNDVFNMLDSFQKAGHFNFPLNEEENKVEDKLLNRDNSLAQTHIMATLFMDGIRAAFWEAVFGLLEIITKIFPAPKPQTRGSKDTQFNRFIKKYTQSIIYLQFLRFASRLYFALRFFTHIGGRTEQSQDNTLLASINNNANFLFNLSENHDRLTDARNIIF